MAHRAAAGVAWIIRLFSSSRYFAAFAVLGTFLAAVTLYVYGTLVVIQLIWNTIAEYRISVEGVKHLQVVFIEMTDVFLLDGPLHRRLRLVSALYPTRFARPVLAQNPQAGPAHGEADRGGRRAVERDVSCLRRRGGDGRESDRVRRLGRHRHRGTQSLARRHAPPPSGPRFVAGRVRGTGCINGQRPQQVMTRPASLAAQR